MDHNTNTPIEGAGENPELRVREGLSPPLASHDAHLSWTDYNDAADQLDLDGYTPEDLKRIAHALGKATRSGNGYSCLCPAHNDHHPSCYISLGEGGKFLACCHAGCDSWSVVKRIHELGLLVKTNGLSSPVQLPLLADNALSIKVKPAESDWDKQGKIEKIWRETRSAQGTFVETYLTARIPFPLPIPDVLRSHHCLWHDETQFQYRAMIAKVTFEGQPDHYVIHRTFLKDDGSGKAKIKPDKKSWGSVKSGSIQLYKAGEVLGVGEGIETCLSVRVLVGVPVWAGISASNMEGLVLPPLPLAQKLLIFIDNDKNNASLNSARKLARRAESEGRDVYIVRPPLGIKDFNDVLNAYWDKDFDARTLIESIDGKNIDFLFGLQSRIQEEAKEGTSPSIFKDDSPEIPEEAYDAAFEELCEDSVTSEEFETPLENPPVDPWDYAIDRLHNSRKNLFITGAAGVGKSTLLQKFRTEMTQKIAVVAPTGVAALNVDGQTIHKFFNFSPDVTPDQVFKNATLSKKEKALYEKLEILIIDEISMVRADMLDSINLFLKKNGRYPDRPFGGVRIIMIGDPYQLPPIVNDEERPYLKKLGYSTPYFFSAYCYEQIELIELIKVYRQKDDSFIALLNRVRNKTMTEADLAILNVRVTDEESFSQKTPAIYLTTTNKKVDAINQEKLDLLEGDTVNFKAEVSGHFKPSEYPAPLELSLKKGARIMMLNNDSEGRWVNGTLGDIEELGESRVFVNLDGSVYPLDPHTWEIGERYLDGDDLKTRNVRIFKQYPLKLAWAMTIHKSQGKTFDRALIDLGKNAFAEGQTYVALSRCTNLEGICLKTPLNMSHIRVDHRVTQFLNQAKEQEPFEEPEALPDVDGNAERKQSKSSKNASDQPLHEESAEYLGKQKEFKVTPSGVYVQTTENKELLTFQSWKWICDPLHITYLARNEKKEAWGKLLEFKDADSNAKEFIMLDEMLAGDGVELRKELMSRGLKIHLDRCSKEKIAQYINSCNPKERAMTSEKIGWVADNVYLLPDRLYGKSKERHLFRPRFGNPPEYEIRGTLEEWQNEIAKPCEGNSRFMFSILISLASVLLKIMNMPNFGIHFYGMSSAGKTTALRVGNSAVGNKINQWRMTDNAAETFALESNDSVLFLDEINQAEAQAVDRMIYMLANASTKARANQHGIKRDTCMTFGCVFVSDGEIPLDAKLREIKKTSTAGQGVRCIEIKVDAGQGMGIVEQLNGFETPEALINHLNTAWSLYRGTAMDRLLQELVKKDLSQVRERLYTIMNRWKSINLEVFENNPDGQVKRVSSNLSLVAAAGELCIALKILPWKQGAAMDTCTRILQDWVFHRGGVEAKELTDVVERLRRLIQEEGTARFDISDDTSDNVGDKTPKRAGTKKSSTIDSEQKWYFCLFRDTMKYEVLKGCDEKVALDYLTRRKILIRNSNGKATKETRVRGMSARVRMYWIDPDALDS